ncbi:hypothetical protein ACVIWV_003016 [Bradyrhizobium diazoefficiens]|jgi:hypothetical protein|nr:hypothetical protein [Bradyrhizobium diazoefficiens]MBP1065269.1 hypothetical protein [Bradyrhizobium japonicum]AND89911.1 hypothetical protein AAV28_20495 [Bradyrhizobium diazoefficiens USDA 110]AWO91580.1 hypothetical protein DI395_25845 [Bradyrhizobium diazoefficiens]MBP1092624.1 hypothetical protein [Bradyrhizobium japonicum]MBR0868283.1 hypothetical protein [Bradyrhizobium diazoefficiens]
MSHFIVRFLKNVVGDRGQPCEACQLAIDVEADDGAEAALMAKQEFCELRAIRDWTLHADRVEVKSADFPS